ncbi:MAG: 23S rRNA (adenine(2030)-N(6))-methyltransferase RlmJ [Cypionkella sp.]
MLSYQHAYHAGNLADVHKHALLAWALDYLTTKDKPLSYIETHAGRGLYDLSGAEADKTGEAAAGIARAEDWLPADHPYRRRLAEVRATHGDKAYPGSPLIAAASLRDGDVMHLCELHPQEFRALETNLAPWGAHVRQEDGLAAALTLTPPTPRRGMMLIDPSYEVKADYDRIPQIIAKVVKRWNVGIVVLWYPILLDIPHVPMLAALTRDFPEGLVSEVRFPPIREGHRMAGSGMFIVNPPYGMAEEAARLHAVFEAHRR